MDENLSILIVELIVAAIAFLVGKYVFPAYKPVIQEHAALFTVLLNYAESFVAYARQFLSELNGEEKMDTVVDKLKDVAKQQSIVVDDETLRAIAQKAYDAMKMNENLSKVIIEAAPVVEEVKVSPGVLLKETTESLSTPDDVTTVSYDNKCE